MRAAILLALSLATVVEAQFTVPENAQTILYFPHLADGGLPALQLQTIVTIVNTNSVAVSVSMNFYRDDGSGWALDLGNGPSNQLSFTIPANGSKVFRSRIASSTIATGWSLGAASLPVLGTVAYLELMNGAQIVEITANSTLPTLNYFSAANRDLGLAIANRFSDIPVNVAVVVSGSDGQPQGQKNVSVGPHGHTSFNLSQLFPALPPNFSGSVVLKGLTARDTFLAWSLGVDSGTWSSLPDGRLTLPVSQYDRIWRAYTRVLSAAQQLVPAFGTQPVNLNISFLPNINASAIGNSITIYMGLAELISDSESELAFAIAHELGHVYQFRRGGRLDFVPTNKEFDADQFGAVVAIGAGYDPYAAAGTLAKLAMATGTAGLITQFEDQFSSDAHKSFNSRLDGIYASIVGLCSDPQYAATCSLYKSVFHPDFPVSVPLVHGKTLAE